MDKPAFPMHEYMAKGIQSNPAYDGITVPVGGLSRRELFAAMAMHGSLADHTIRLSAEQRATLAVRTADVLITALDAEPPE